MSLLTEIQYFQNGPSEKRTHTNESIMRKMFYHVIQWAIENNYLLINKFFDFLVE